MVVEIGVIVIALAQLYREALRPPKEVKWKGLEVWYRR